MSVTAEPEFMAESRYPSQLVPFCLGVMLTRRCEDGQQLSWAERARCDRVGQRQASVPAHAAARQVDRVQRQVLDVLHDMLFDVLHHVLHGVLFES